MALFSGFALIVACGVQPAASNTPIIVPPESLLATPTHRPVLSIATLTPPATPTIPPPSSTPALSLTPAGVELLPPGKILPTNKPKGKLSARLQILADPTLSDKDVETQARALGLPATGSGSLLRNEKGDLLLYIRLTDVSETNLESLTAMGVTLVNVAEEYKTVTAYVSPAQLSALSALEVVANLEEVLSP